MVTLFAQRLAMAPNNTAAGKKRVHTNVLFCFWSIAPQPKYALGRRTYLLLVLSLFPCHLSPHLFSPYVSMLVRSFITIIYRPPLHTRNANITKASQWLLVEKKEKEGREAQRVLILTQVQRVRAMMTVNFSEGKLCQILDVYYVF